MATSTQVGLLDEVTSPSPGMQIRVSEAGSIATDFVGLTEAVKRKSSSSEMVEATFGTYRSDRANESSDFRKRSIRDFYTTQDAVLDSFEEADSLILNNSTSDTYSTEVTDAQHQTSPNRWINIATNLSLGTNVVLLIIKIVVLVSTGSLAVLSSVVDSGLDLFSGTVIFLTNRYMNRRDRYLFPMGKQRFEPLATVIIASVMATAAIELVSKAIQAIVADDSEPKINALDLALLGTTVAAKMGLHLLCRVLPGPSMSTLAADHFNDCMSNGVAMVTAWLGSKYWANADPVGAILIGLFIIVTWYFEGREHVLNLAGRGASPAFIQQLTWVAMHHDDRVKLVDTVRAIHFGCNFLVEVDIVLPPEMPLHEAHDIGESLQHKLELLPSCDRAHVHLDYEIDHGPEDEHKRL